VWAGGREEHNHRLKRRKLTALVIYIIKGIGENVEGAKNKCKLWVMGKTNE